MPKKPNYYAGEISARDTANDLLPIIATLIIALDKSTKLLKEHLSSTLFSERMTITRRQIKENNRLLKLLNSRTTTKP